MTQRRNRRKSPPPAPLGLESIDQWRASAENVTWASVQPHFRRAVGVVINERINVIDHAPLPTACVLTEQARYGMAMGYEAAIRVLLKMAETLGPPPEPDLEQDFAPPATHMEELAVSTM